MPTPLSDSTLEQFRAAIASAQPVPAGVTAAAVSASFALGLLAKALTVSGRHKELSGHLARLEPLAAAAQAGSKRMLQLAADDVCAFEVYLAGARLPRSTARERHDRRDALDRAVERAIELPLAAAREAAAGLELCAAACPLTHLALIADLGACASLLASGLRVFLMCAESNVRQLTPDASRYRVRLAEEAQRQEHGLSRAQAVLAHVASALGAATRPENAA